MSSSMSSKLVAGFGVPVECDAEGALCGADFVRRSSIGFFSICSTSRLNFSGVFDPSKISDAVNSVADSNGA